MISLCILARNTPHLDKLVYRFSWATRNYDLDYEVVIGDNSSKREYTKQYLTLADVYVKITDKELFRMGIPFAHNRIASLANSYKIFYVDSDEYPIFVHPLIEEMYDKYYIPTCLRGDFYTYDEILNAQSVIFEKPDMRGIEQVLEGKEVSRQDRLYNSRYVKFEGLCHSIFWAPDSFRSKEIGAVLLHNSDVRDANPREEYTRPVIQEQYARQNKNPFLASSPNVLGWGKGKTHQYKDFNEFVKKCRKK